MPSPRQLHHASTRVLSAVMMLLGVVILVRTIVAGGGQVGLLLGPLFIAAGAARLYLQRNSKHG